MRKVVVQKKGFAPVLGSLVGAAVAAVLAATPASAASLERMIVIYKNQPGAANAVRDQVARAGGRVMREITAVNALAVRVPKEALDALRNNASVEVVEPDAERHILGARTQRKPAAIAPTAEGAEVVPYGITMVQADQLSDAATGNRTLCIIDSGIDASHPDHAGNRLAGVNLTTSGSWNTDESTHGTHVAGTVAAIGGNGLGVVGVNPGGQLNLYIAKVFDASGSAEDSVVMEAVVKCADAGANIISMSLGGGVPTIAENRLFADLARRGVLSIASAGNDGNLTMNYPAGYADVMSVAAVDSSMKRAGFSQVNRDVEIAGPGVAVLSTIPPNVESLGLLSVAGTPYDAAAMTGAPRTSATAPLVDFGTGEVDDPAVAGKVCLIKRGNIAFADKVVRCQSNGGVGAVIYNNTTGTLFGTLGGTATTIPSVGTSDTAGAQLLALVGQPATVSIVPDPALYAEFDGTSMAAPHVSGVAALVWSYFPTCTGNRIRQALNASAKDIALAGKDRFVGNGLVQAKSAHDWLATNGCGAN